MVALADVYGECCAQQDGGARGAQDQRGTGGLAARPGGGGSVTLRGLVAELADRGLLADYHTMWNFGHGEGLSFKKNRARQ